MKVKQVVLLDLDGTIADLYGEENWLDRLHKEDSEIFKNCKPLITQETLESYYPRDKYEIRVCTMTPKNASASYHKNVIDQKNQWLNEYFPHLTKRIFLPYGNDKNIGKSENYILVDDSKEVRKTFKGLALYPQWL